jgi:diguanylate cyclase (GGDEF)-like protein/PAS domain S-box-containing protein
MGSMRFDFFQRHSLKTRVTLFTLVIFVLSLWSLSLFAGHELRTDMQQMLSQQQTSAVTMLTNEVHHELADRLTMLEQVAARIDNSLMASTGALQTHLETQLLLNSSFNGGAMILNQMGQAIAELPRDAGRVGLSFMDRDYARSSLLQGQSAYGSPVEGRALKSPLIDMAVPIRNKQGNVVGALVGITDLSRPSFLDLISEGRYGQTGGYLLIDPKLRRVITASDHRRIFEQLPAPGENAAIDQFLSGFSGTQRMRNPQGVDLLATDRTISATGWIMAVTLPIEEAFAPIRAMQHRMLVATFLLTVLATLLTWWMIHYQLEPVESTVETLARRTLSGQSLEPLEVKRHDEIGGLIHSFNILLATIEQQQNTLENQQTMLIRAETAAHLGSWQWDMATDHVVWSQEMYRIFDLDPYIDAPPIAGQAKYFSTSDMERLRETINTAKNHYGPCQTELTVVRPDGSSRFCIARFQIHMNDLQQVEMLYGSFQDVTETKQAQLKMELAAKVFTYAHEGITITDDQGTILDVNDNFSLITGYSREEAMGRNPRFLKSGREDAAFYEVLWQTLLSDGHWSGEIWNRRKNGDIYPEQLNISAVRDTQGITRQYVALFSDITGRKEVEAQVRQLAFFDPLTSLPNRRLLTDRLNQALLINKRNNRFGAVMFLDLDNFKPLNDSYGHAMGDLLLVEVAKRLKNCVREVDTVARIGGDEFMILLSELDANPQSSAEQALAVAEKVRLSLAESFLLSQQPQQQQDSVVKHHCTCSVGVALLTTDTTDYEAVIKLADAAMYQAKDQGRNRVVFAKPAKTSYYICSYPPNMDRGYG